MKTSDRRILYGVLAVAALIAFYFLVISPKRAELSDLGTQVSTAESAAAEQEQLAVAAEQAKGTYRSSYQHLVLLGKAVPGDDDVSSLLDQVSSQADSAGIEFRSLTLAAGGGEAAAAPPSAAPTPVPTEAGSPLPVGATAPATEAAAALQPLGAAVGSAGLPTMPYDLTFSGGFFDIADFMSGLDGMVKVRADGLGVDGRLLTIDGFSLTPADGGFPNLNVNLHVTSYVTPADQGLTAGATAAAPAPATSTTPAATPGATPAPPLATAAPMQ